MFLVSEIQGFTNSQVAIKMIMPLYLACLFLSDIFTSCKMIF